MAPNLIVATELSQPTLEYIDTGARHSDLLTKTALENENDTGQQLCLMGMLAAEWENFGGFLVLSPSAVWVKCTQRQTQTASVLGW